MFNFCACNLVCPPECIDILILFSVMTCVLCLVATLIDMQDILKQHIDAIDMLGY